MGGKSGTTTSKVTIPADVLARYNSVNAQAQQAASQPFQPYSSDPNAFVAPINPTQQSAISNINSAQNIYQPYYDAATQYQTNAQAQASPYYDAATQNVTGASDVGAAGTAAAYNPLAQGAGQAQALQGTSLGAFLDAQQQAQPYNEGALQAALMGTGAAVPFFGQAAGNIGTAQGQGAGITNQALGTLRRANSNANPIQNAAAGNISGALGTASPLQGSAASGISQAQAGAQPYQQLATGLGLAGAGAVNPGAIDANSINQYMSPYVGDVVNSTLANLHQQQQTDQSTLLGGAAQAGAFGGDRAGIAQANLAKQQNMASAQVQSELLNNAYGQALSTAQQQQGVGLGAGQANRAAIQNAASQLQGIGQQGFQQGLGTAQAQAQLGQQLYGQQTGTGQAEAALGQQLFGQGAQTSEQQAALGQQLYGQGITAAQAQQSLGQGYAGLGQNLANTVSGIGQQQYGQTSGTGQNLASLGQQTFGQGAAQSQQQAALAQQLFGQGMSTAQQQQALGQGVYGMNAATSQGLAALGTGAQQNALGAAQAQLGAGTAQQQTSQAQLSALYNQFLQQQGYPFQVSQFLANIAEGTGALSGSTTSTTQPMPFFSDERLKEDIKPIGKTFDGQNIVKFRYKNQPGTRLGLIAQDVEKKHPDAVGLDSGYKTVDYDAATRDSERGNYAMGGGAGKIDPSDIASIVEAQGQMYPFAKGGLYGTPAPNIGGSGPYGVGLASGAQGLQLMRPTEAPPPATPALKDAISSASDAANIYKTGKDIFGKKKEEPPTPEKPTTSSGSTSDFDMSDIFNRGGLVPRKNYDVGGMPYSQGVGYIPDDVDKPKKPEDLPKPGGQGGSQQPSTFSQIMDMGKDIAAFAMMLNRGGRVGYADGGSPDDDSAPDDDAFNQAADRALKFEGSEINKAEGSRYGVFSNEVGGKRPEEITPEDARGAYRTYWNKIGADKMDPQLAQVAFDTALNQGSGAAQTMIQNAGGDAGKLLDLRQDAYNKLAEAHPDKYAKYLKGWTNRVNALRADLSPNQKPQAGLAPPDSGQTLDKVMVTAPRPEGLSPVAVDRPAAPSVQMDDQGQTGGQDPTNVAVAPRASAGAGDKDKKDDYWSRNSDWILPLLSGVGTMASSNSRYLGSALLQGVGGGAESYMKMQQQAADIAQRKAGALNTGAQTASIWAKLPSQIKETLARAGLSEEQSNQLRMLRSYEINNLISTGQLTQAEAAQARAGAMQIIPIMGTSNMFVLDKSQGTGHWVQMGQESPAGASPPAAGATAPPAQPTVPAPNAPGAAPAASPGAPNAAPAPVPPAAGVTPPAGGSPQTHMMQTAQVPKGMSPADVYLHPKPTMVPKDYVDPNRMYYSLDHDAKESALKLSDQWQGSTQEAATSAQNTLRTLDLMDRQFSNMPAEGWLASGAGIEPRKNLAVAFNTLSAVMGGKPIVDPDQVGAVEELFKDNTKLGFALGNSLGPREAAQIINAAMRASPGPANTPLGYARLSSAAREAAQYDIDKAAFFTEFKTKNGHLVGAQELWEKLNPVQRYADNAVIDAIPKSNIPTFVSDWQKRGKDALPAFDKHFGNGAGEILAQRMGLK